MKVCKIQDYARRVLNNHHHQKRNRHKEIRMSKI